jgi:hypothetical integral membrane protein (TIGR02206 family)
MFTHLFNYLPSTIPAKYALGLFTPTHLSFLLLEFILGWQLVKYYKNANETKRKKIRTIVGISVLLLEVGRELIIGFMGDYQPQNMPLHLCGLSVFVVFADSIISRFKTLSNYREMLYALTLPGALAALITPDWVYYPLFNIFALQSFIIHGLLVSYVIMLLVSKELVPNYKRLWQPILFLLIVVPIDIQINKYLGTNFFFMNSAVPGSPLEPLQKTFGSYYILSMIGLLAVVWILMYLPWQISQLKYTNRKGNA